MGLGACALTTLIAIASYLVLRKNALAPYHSHLCSLNRSFSRMFVRCYSSLSHQHAASGRTFSGVTGFWVADYNARRSLIDAQLDIVLVLFVSICHRNHFPRISRIQQSPCGVLVSHFLLCDCCCFMLHTRSLRLHFDRSFFIVATAQPAFLSFLCLSLAYLIFTVFPLRSLVSSRTYRFLFIVFLRMGVCLPFPQVLHNLLLDLFLRGRFQSFIPLSLASLRHLYSRKCLFLCLVVQMNDFTTAMSLPNTVHTPDALEAALEAFMDSAPLSVKEEIFSDPDESPPQSAPSTQSGFLAILDRNQAYHGPEPFTMPTPQAHLAESSKMHVGVCPPEASEPLKYDSSPRRIAVTVVQADTAITGTWIVPACQTPDHLRRLCGDVWGITMDFLHENQLQPNDKPLYYFDARLVNHQEHSRIALFAVNLHPIPSFTAEKISVHKDDEVTLIPVFNVTQSKSANFITPTYETTRDLFGRVAFEWQHTCDHVYRNATLGPGTRIHELADLTQQYQSPILVYEAHALCPGDRYFKHPILSRHFPVLHPRRSRRFSPPQCPTPGFLPRVAPPLDIRPRCFLHSPHTNLHLFHRRKLSSLLPIHQLLSHRNVYRCLRRGKKYLYRNHLPSVYARLLKQLAPRLGIGLLFRKSFCHSCRA